MYRLTQRNSDQDNKFNNSYIEYDIFALWKIDLINLIKIKAVISKNFHIQPSEIDKMPMWEYEIFMDEINNLIKSENEEHQAQMDKYNVPTPNQLKNMSERYTPKIPNMNFKMPNIK